MAAGMAPAGIPSFRFSDGRRRWSPEWAHLNIPPIDFQAISYYSAPKQKPELESLDEVDPELIDTFNKLGIPLAEQERLVGIAVDVVMDSVSVTTTFNKELEKNGIIFCSFSEAVQNHPELIQKYLGSVVPHTDNFFAALNSAVFSDGSFAISRKACNARLNCPPISESMKPERDSSNEPLS